MVNVRISVLAVPVAAGVLFAACGGGGSTGTSTGTTSTTSSSHAASSGATSSTTSTGSGGSTTTAMPKPPDLNNIPAPAPPVLTWSTPTPCDTVEIERQDMMAPFPPTPQFMVPGTMMTYTDTTATQTNNTYFYRARCVVMMVRSAWSNEVAWAHP
jgi:hypothetical protein